SHRPPYPTIRTSKGKLPTAPYRPSVLGTTSSYIVFFPGDDTITYSAYGDSIVMIHREDNCSNPEQVTDYPSDHFWWTQGFGQLSADGKTLEGNQDTPDGLGSVIHTDGKFTKR